MRTTVAEPRQSDEQLAREAAREGSDGPAFTELAERLRDRVWRVCFRIMGNAEDAADATQDVLVRMFTHRQKYAGKSKYSTWVHGIAIRTCLDRRRQRGRRQQRVSLAPDINLDNPAPQPAATDSGWDIDAMLSTLTEEDRALVVMKYTEDYSHEELSEMFNLSVSACKMRISRAVTRLRETFDR